LKSSTVFRQVKNKNYNTNSICLPLSHIFRENSDEFSTSKTATGIGIQFQYSINYFPHEVQLYLLLTPIIGVTYRSLTTPIGHLILLYLTKI